MRRRVTEDRGLQRTGAVSVVLGVILASFQIAASCTDGVTPDCSDPTVCAPGAPDATIETSSVIVPEAGVDAGRDAATISDADADADGG